MSHFVCMDDTTLSQIITCSAAGVFLVCAWATYWIWRGRESGWARLATFYAAAPRRDSMPRRWQTIRFVPSRILYPGLITFRLTVDGLYAVPWWPCRVGHEPLLIPWDDISIWAVETYPSDRLYDLQLTREPRIKIRIGVTAAQFIRRAADNSQYFANAAVSTPAQSRPRALPTPKPIMLPAGHETAFK